jgi:hypothetical protein
VTRVFSPCVFFLLFTLHVTAQIPSIQLTIETDQQSSVHGFYFWNEVVLLSTSEKRNATISPTGNFIFQHLPPGKYTLQFTSRFHQTFTKSIALKKNKKVKVKLRAQLKKSSSSAFTSKWKEGDTLYVLHNASGVSVDKQELRFAVQQGKIIALLFENNKLSQRAELTEIQKKFLLEIEKEAVRLPGPGGCSVIESYTFQLNGKYFSFNDYTCSWNGFQRLRDNIFSE